MQRIAFVRTWTFVSHRPDWLADSGHWQARARGIEDRLSDALHERLTQRFVDRRAATLQRQMRGGRELLSAVTREGTVLVEGEPVGRLEGFRFIPDAAGSPEEAKAMLGAAHRALRTSLPDRAKRCLEEPDEAFALRPDGRILWREAPLAVLQPGETLLAPRISLAAPDLAEPGLREALRRHLVGWLDRHVRTVLAPLHALEAAALEGAARGLAFQLKERLGTVPRHAVRAQLAALDRHARRVLRRHGVVLGIDSVYLPALLKPRPVALKALLWAVHHDMVDLVAPPAAGRMSVPLDPSIPPAFCEAIGYRAFGRIAVRADRLDRLARAARPLAAAGPFLATPALLALVGCTKAEIAPLLAAIGYRPQPGEGEPRYAFKSRSPRARRGGADTARAAKRAAQSPFAALTVLKFGR